MIFVKNRLWTNVDIGTRIVGYLCDRLDYGVLWRIVKSSVSWARSNKRMMSGCCGKLEVSIMLKKVQMKSWIVKFLITDSHGHAYDIYELIIHGLWSWSWWRISCNKQNTNITEVKLLLYLDTWCWLDRSRKNQLWLIRDQHPLGETLWNIFAQD